MRVLHAAIRPMVPLTISYEDDLGGNRIKPIRGAVHRVDHLHGVWDSGIIGLSACQTDWWTYADRLQSTITPEKRTAWRAAARSEWAQESYKITTEELTQ